MRVVLAATLALACLSGCDTNKNKDIPKPVATSHEADRLAPEVKPGGYCATSRLGKRVVMEGGVYVCSGPKPYRWRKA